MTFDERQKFISQFLETHCFSVLKSKGKEYSRGEEDCNSNFKRVGAALGLDPKQVCIVYLLKHFDAISNYMKTGIVETESIESRIGDAINYLFILASLIEEDKGVQIKNNVVHTYGREFPLCYICELLIIGNGIVSGPQGTAHQTCFEKPYNHGGIKPLVDVQVGKAKKHHEEPNNAQPPLIVFPLI